MSALPKELRETLAARIAGAERPREAVVDVMFQLQRHFGHLTDEAVAETARLLGMTPLEVEELATFYEFIYREPVGRLVIHVCDGVVCWMSHEGWEEGLSVFEYLSRKLGLEPGGTTADGVFTLLPTACIGQCDHAPAMLINGIPYGSLTPDRIDAVLEELRRGSQIPGVDR
jgi:NADH-quinone oxidoreductase subunit E